MAGTVTVACKIPQGLILRVFEDEIVPEPVMGGGFRDAKRAKQKGEPVKINGSAVPFGKLPDCVVAGGYALTPGVDADFWLEWLCQNQDSDVVKNGLIFAHEKQTNASAEAKEKADLRSGFEPIDPSRLPRGVETASRVAA